MILPLRCGNPMVRFGRGHASDVATPVPALRLARYQATSSTLRLDAYGRRTCRCAAVGRDLYILRGGGGTWVRSGKRGLTRARGLRRGREKTDNAMSPVQFHLVLLSTRRASFRYL